MPSPDDYTYIFTTQGLAAFEGEVLRLITVLRADGYPAQASVVREAYARLLAELREIAAKTATKAQQAIRREEAGSRVRPDTLGDGGPRLGDWIGQSHPMPQVEGSVGINFIPDLIANVPWWWTNEYGYSGHIGREIRGYFFEQGFSSPSRPDPSRFREHPLFMSGKDQGSLYGDLGFSGGAGPRGGKGGKGTIRNPVPDRHFVAHGTDASEVAWRRDIERAKARCMNKIRAALAAATPKPGAPSRRGPRPPRPPGRRP